MHHFPVLVFRWRETCCVDAHSAVVICKSYVKGVPVGLVQFPHRRLVTCKVKRNRHRLLSIAVVAVVPMYCRFLHVATIVLGSRSTEP